MSEYRALLERARTQFPAPELPVETVLRRRDRRQRRRRIGAGVVGLVVAALVFGGLLRELTLERRTPADETPAPAPVGSVRFTSSLYGYSIAIPSDWTASAANIEWKWGESLDEGSWSPYSRDDAIYGDKASVAIAAMAIPQDLTQQQWLDRVEVLATEWCDEPVLVEPLAVDGAAGRLVQETCAGGTKLFFVSAGRGYRVSGSEENLRWVASTIQLETEPPRDPPVSADAWRGIWPQTTREEAETAQAGANAGASAHTWQTRANPAEGQGAAVGVPIATRFVEEQLGWSSYWMYRGGTGDGVGELYFIRCAPDRTNTAYPSFPCAPTDGNRFPTALVRIERLVEPARGGIWVVTRGEEISPFEQAVPPTEQDIRDLIGVFAEARIAGEGAEPYLQEDGGQVQLLYTTSAGEPYESFEIVEQTAPDWPDGEVRVTLRMLASDGGIVVEQTLAVMQRGPEYTWLPDGLWIEGGNRATENGAPVATQYGILDGRVTFAANEPWMSTWFNGVVEGDETILSKGDEGTLGGRTAYLAVLADPWLPHWSGCPEPPYDAEQLGSPASAEELARGIVGSSELAASAPETLAVGGVEAVRLDVTPAAGATPCRGFPGRGVSVVITTHSGAGDAHPFVVKPDEQMRLFILELPGEPGRALAIVIIATADAFDRVVEAATPIIDSIWFDEG